MLTSICQFALLDVVCEETQVAEGSLRVPALLFYTGYHCDSKGNADHYSDEDISRIYADTLAYLATGRRIKFYKDHCFDSQIYTYADAIGLVSGPFSLGRIETPDQCPFPEMFAELTGRLGIFGYIDLVDPEAILRYRGKLLKEISVGIPSGSGSRPIIECSAVAQNALKGAALFAKEKGTRNMMALTLSAAFSEEQLRDLRWELCDLVENFMSVIWNIDHATAEDLGDKTSADLKMALAAEFTTMLNGWVERSASVPVPSENMITIMTDGLTPDQIQHLRSRIDAIRVEDEQLTRMQFASQFASSMIRASQMVATGKLPPVAYDLLFGDEPASEKQFAAFSSTLKRSPVEVVLDMFDKLDPVVFSGFRAQEPLEGPPANEQEVASHAERIMSMVGL